MKVDYIIVGYGLAGMTFIAQLQKARKTFVVYDDNPNRNSRVIGGMYNPIILKRFTPAWKAHEMWQTSLSFYKELEDKFKKSYIKPIKIRRIFQSIEEQNNWVVASDKAIMSEYMQPQILIESIKGIKADYGFGVMDNVGKVLGTELLEDYKQHLIEKSFLLEETFDYTKLQIHKKTVNYKEIQAKKVVFTEGSYLPKNPFFNYLPMKAAKGEMLIIEVPDLTIDFTIKSGVFMVPYGDNKYIVGATYNWDDKTFKPTKQAREELEKKLIKFLLIPYKILDYKVGIRPTIKDRRPLVGRHPNYANLAILNGLGTRGVIIAPAIAEILFNHLENNMQIADEMNIKRYNELSF